MRRGKVLLKHQCPLPWERRRTLEGVLVASLLSGTDQTSAPTLADSPRGLFSTYRVGHPCSPVSPQSPSPEISSPASLLTYSCSAQERKCQVLGTQDPTRQQGPCPRRVTAWGSAFDDWTLSRCQGPRGVLTTTRAPERCCTTQSKVRRTARWSPLQECTAERQETGLSRLQGGGSHRHA